VGGRRGPASVLVRRRRTPASSRSPSRDRREIGRDSVVDQPGLLGALNDPDASLLTTPSPHRRSSRLMLCPAYRGTFAQNTARSSRNPAQGSVAGVPPTVRRVAARGSHLMSPFPKGLHVVRPANPRTARSPLDAPVVVLVHGSLDRAASFRRVAGASPTSSSHLRPAGYQGSRGEPGDPAAYPRHPRRGLSASWPQ